MPILDTNNNYAGPKSLVYTVYTAAHAIDWAASFWALAQQQATPAGWSAAANLAVRSLIDTVLRNATPIDLIRYYDLLEDSDSGWSDLGISSINDTTVGEALSATYKSELLALLAATAVAWLTELHNEIDDLLT